MVDPTRRPLWRALYQAAKWARDRELTGYPERFYKMLDALEAGKEIEGLEEIRPLMKELLGYDPLEENTLPKGEKQPPSGAGVRNPSLQDLKRKIYSKAKAEPQKRFWGLYVHVSKRETLREAYRMHRTLGLYNDYQVRWYRPQAKARPC